MAFVLSIFGQLVEVTLGWHATEPNHIRLTALLTQKFLYSKEKQKSTRKCTVCSKKGVEGKKIKRESLMLTTFKTEQKIL